MADYNVNMKQWNGTSFDNVLPLAYNAKQLGGQSLAEVKQWVQDNNLLLYTGQYTGTGTYGASNPVSIQFPFEPKLFIFPISQNEDYPISTPLDTGYLTTSYKQVGRVSNVSSRGAVSGYYLMARFSNIQRTELQIYSTSSAINQSNKSSIIYYFAAIGGYDIGGQTEWMITSSGSWTVPRTGRYMLELYGGGGGVSDYTSIREGRAVQGGSSCQRYDSISLTAGDSIAVTIGVGGSTPLGGTTSPATGTSFGTYSVDGGGTGNGGTSTGGSGSGNLGTTGSVISYSTTNKFNNNNGTFGSLYGVGGWGGRSSSSSGVKPGTNGAVYLKYLGA